MLTNEREKKSIIQTGGLAKFQMEGEWPVQRDRESDGRLHLGNIDPSTNEQRSFCLALISERK